MKITKFNFLKLVAKHFSIKLGKEVTSEAELGLIATSITPVFAMYIPRMKKANLLSEGDEINIDLLEPMMEQFFETVPILNFPFAGTTLRITKKDIEIFLKDLRKHGIVENIIYLPCH